MDTAAKRRLRPLALLCALLFVLWGLASGAALVAHIMNGNEFGWPDEDAIGDVIAVTYLPIAAAATGILVAIAGVLGIWWRPSLHVGALLLLVAVGLEVAAIVVLLDFYSASTGDRLTWGAQLEGYIDRVTFQTDGRFVNETRAFFTALPFVTAPLPFLVYLAALFSGAGRRERRPSSAGPGGPQQHAYPPPPPSFRPERQDPPRAYPPPPPDSPTLPRPRPTHDPS